MNDVCTIDQTRVMAVVLASFVGTVKLYDLGRTGVLRGEHVFLVRNPVNAYIGACR